MSRKIGNIIEEYAYDTFNLAPYMYNGFCDALLMNIPIEIKGVLKHPLDNVGHNKNGRVWITNQNHKRLCEENGMYLFVVYDYPGGVYEYGVESYEDINICYILFVAAYRIKINGGKNTKISYKKLLELM